MAIGFVFSPPGGIAWDVALFNRVVGAGVLWLTSVFVFQRKRMEVRLEHVNRVLRAIRRANQLIVVEKDRDRLTTSICNLLTEARAYLDVWVALLDDSGNLVATAESGVGSEFLQLVEQLQRHEFPYCVRRAMTQSSLVVIDDPTSTCADCPLAEKYVGRGMWTIRLEHAGRIYGVLSASVPAPVTAHKEEQELFRELAGDLALALTGIRLEQERKQMEDALTEAENRYRTLFDSASDAILIHDMRARFLEVNQVACERLGYSREELLQMTPKDIQPPGHGKAVENRVEELRRVEHAFFETAHIRRDGTIIPIELSSRIIQYKGKPAVLSIARDITERKKAEKQLQQYSESLEQLVFERTSKLAESETRFREFADLLPQIAFETDEKGNFTFANRAGLALTGYAQEDIDKGLNALQLFAPEDWNTFQDRFKRILGGEPSVGSEYTILRKDGSPFPVIMHIVPIVRENRGVGLRGIAVDISERKKMEARLAESQRLAAIGETTAMVGHDLRNPLQGLATTLYLAKKILKSPKAAEKQEATKLLDTVDEEVYYMDKIVSDLQSYAAPLTPKLSPTDAGQLIRDTVSAIGIPANVKVTITTKKDMRKAELDGVLMRRVFTNLVANATQAMPKGGKLTIKAQTREGDLLISFQDTGAGIPEENFPKLFSPFFTTKAKGQGLGLPVCKRLVEAQGGSIAVQSKVGEGSTFTVRLPLKRQ
ncbi:MAG: PAS domain S-box protein [Candidatus Bathyarchaeia archaeon]